MKSYQHLPELTLLESLRDKRCAVWLAMTLQRRKLVNSLPEDLLQIWHGSKNRCLTCRHRCCVTLPDHGQLRDQLMFVSFSSGRRIKPEGQGCCPAFPWLQSKRKSIGRTCLRQLWAGAGLWAAQDTQRECHGENCYYEIWENISRK